jgi:glycosyltransferase involved in cell wall biosynthesis
MRAVAIVPAYQAEASVADVVRALIAVWPDGPLPKVLVVDDGSSDGTADAARAAGATVLRHAVNRGKGAALVTALEYARGLGAGVAVSVDADGQHPADQARALLECGAPAHALVLGVRDLARDGAPRLNRTSNALSNFFLSWFSGTRLLDTQCGLRRYAVAETLALGAQGQGFAYEAEVVLRAAREGMPIVQVPVRVVYPPRHERVTHFHAVRDPARIVGRVLCTLATPRNGR